jgi:hypothetical protein
MQRDGTGSRDDNAWWKDENIIHQHGVLSVMRGFSRSDAHAARLPQTGHGGQ